MICGPDRGSARVGLPDLPPRLSVTAVSRLDRTARSSAVDAPVVHRYRRCASIVHLTAANRSCSSERCCHWRRQRRPSRRGGRRLPAAIEAARDAGCRPASRSGRRAIRRGVAAAQRPTSSSADGRSAGPRAVVRLCGSRCPRRVASQVEDHLGRRRELAARPLRGWCERARRPAGDLRARGSAARLPPAGTSDSRDSPRAVELAGQAAGRAYPKPTVGAVVVRDGEIVGEGVTEPGGRHGEVVALDAAGEPARGATLYVTLEPARTGARLRRAPNAILAAGVDAGRRRLARSESGGGRRARDAARSRRRGRARRLRSRRALRTRPGGRGCAQGRPFVTYKVAITLDGRVAVPGERWVIGRGEPHARPRAARGLRRRRRRHGHGAGRRAAARRARGGDAARPAAPARLRRGPLPPRARARAPHGAARGRARARSPPRACSRCCSRAARRSPAAFLEADLVDKLLVFVAPTLRGRRAAVRCRG